MRREGKAHPDRRDPSMRILRAVESAARRSRFPSRPRITDTALHGPGRPRNAPDGRTAARALPSPRSSRHVAVSFTTFVPPRVSAEENDVSL
jgi:hypothetical protein